MSEPKGHYGYPAYSKPERDALVSTIDTYRSIITSITKGLDDTNKRYVAFKEALDDAMKGMEEHMRR